MGERHQRVKQHPQLSLSMLGEYMASSFVRKQAILRDAKFPSDFMGPRYDPAQKAAAVYLAAGSGDQAQLRRDLDAKLTGSERSPWFKSRDLLCHQAIECIVKLDADLKLENVDVAPGGNPDHRMVIAGVVVTVIPDLIVRGVNRKGPFIGAVKFRYGKTKPITEKWAAYSATLLHEFADEHLSGEEVHADHRHCRLIDVFSGRIHEAPERFKELRKDVNAACQQIRELWKSVERV